jgi:N-carbamoyl-L-amino-acid hydrolase
MKFAVQTERVQADLDALAAISEQPAPVVTRVLFSPADLQARTWVKKRFAALGLTIREDAVGNIFARWSGSDPSLSAVATGSHIDAIPNAGKYDGVLGVLGPLESVRALQAAGFQPRRSLEIIVFTAEEPTRFGLGCLGSRLLSGVLAPDQAEALKDGESRTLAQWRRQAGCAETSLSTVRRPTGAYHKFIELHIEQGPLLEKENLDIGVVEKIAAPSSLRLTLCGEGGHAGAVLMSERHDALLAGAEIALAVEKAALESGSPDTVGTSGVFQIAPGAVNSVPCRAYLEIDLRDTNTTTRDRAFEQIEQAARAICARRGVTCDLALINRDPPALCDTALVQLALLQAQQFGYTTKKMISRAYHDSLFMAQICPTAMIFIPCFRGYSHRPDEYSSPAQIEKGVNVLTGTLAELMSS